MLYVNAMHRYLATLPLKPYLAPTLKDVRLRTVRPSVAVNSIEGVIGGKTRNLARLKKPIHLQFANWLSTPGGVLSFTRQYGPLQGQYVPGERFELYVSKWRTQQGNFRAFWQWNSRKDKWDVLVTALRDQLKYVSGALTTGDTGDLEFWPSEPSIDFALGRHRTNLALTLAASDLWQYILLLFIQEPLGMLRLCNRNDCEEPHYIARRRDQKFCSKYCAGLVAQRRWWKAHGEEWRRKWKRKKKLRR